MPAGVGRMRFIDEEMVAPKITKSMFLRIIKYFSPHWKYMLIAILLIFVSSLLGLVPPIVIKYILNQALPQKNLGLLGVLILISVSSTIIGGLLQVGQTYLNNWIAKTIIFDMKNHMYSHLQHMSLKFFTSAKPGEIITRLTSDIDGISDIFNSTFVNALSSSFILLSTIIVLITLNWQLAIVSMVILPLFVLPTRKVGKVRWNIASKSQAKISELNQIIQETLSISGSILMQIFTQERNEYEKFKDSNQAVTKLQIRESLAGRWFIMTISTLTAIGPMIIYLFGGYLFIHGEISVGDIVAFVALLGRLYAPATQLSNIHIDVTRSFALFDRIFDYFDQPQEIVDMPNAKQINSLRGKVEFEHVYFSYDNQIQVLNDIDFAVEPGMMVALVGSSGAGKTTITNLIPRLYEVSDGKVKIDGVDIKDFTLESLRRKIGIVMQEPYLFNATIADNLRYGKPDVTEPEMIEACQAAHIHEFIMTLPNKYQTIVGNRGIKLSGGEKQRISIARVILKDPNIIILDEATSALDSVSEELIQKAMQPLLQGRTSFVIAHRLSTVLAADRIIVVAKGQIREMGRHQELLNLNGIYRTLYDTQFKLQDNI